MPIINVTPKALRPYLFHGLHLEVNGSEQATGACPFCGREGKFSVKVSTGEYQCWSCREGNNKGGGNTSVFLRKLWEYSDRTTNGATNVLAANRKLLYPETLTFWGVVQSIITHDWMVPGYGITGRLNQLYRYLKDNGSGRYKLLPTPELHHQVHLPISGFDPKKPDVYVCEGPWDGIALWEVLRFAKVDSEGALGVTGSETSSLLNRANVVAVPGCGSIGEPFKRLLPLFAGKRVILMFDNDYPRAVNGRAIEPAGYSACKRAVQLLSSAEQPPAEIHYLNWGKEGYDKEFSDGFDVRDFLSRGATVKERLEKLRELQKRITVVPAGWIAGRSNAVAAAGGLDIECLECSSWRVLISSWRKALRWTPGLDRAMSVMLACVASTKVVGDQLWCKIIGPASCGKSTLCEALSVNKTYVLAKSTIRGFHSGYQSDRDGAEDNSLVKQLYGKTLVTKDGDTLLQSPNLEQILSEARDLYDCTSRTHYRNKTARDYQGVRMTWVLCGTSSLRQIDSSELGERFLDCVIMEGIDDEIEDEILWRVVNRTDRAMSAEANGDLETQHAPEMVKAMRLTGGYVSYLRENIIDLLSGTAMSEATLRKCLKMGKFVSYMRARPSKKQDETAEREFAARLASQMVRLAKCLAVVLGTPGVDTSVMERVKRVALDTARGRTLELVRYLYNAGDGGATLAELSNHTGQSETAERNLLKFLRRIGAVGWYHAKRNGINTGVKWRLLPKMRELYREVLDESRSVADSPGSSD